ncbi:MarR family winged helix-turn-helix transcriptional regulator [Kocuria marina]|uniref:MarR family winged helix-turn-helix transcriptional regulator n=1 Tax=Kocuria marina TaxID=223184 RepID=UPI002989CD73|nr:MarR family winged helix-turn-helix transcriptional regulator [Kocuria marina]MCT2361649.1 MarR family winged helix-turn-helix transcriptional regulator [Kocuria marina]
MSDTATSAVALSKAAPSGSAQAETAQAETAPSKPVTGSDGAHTTGAACIGGAESLDDAARAGISDASRQDWDAWQVYFETTALLTARIEERLKQHGCSLMDYQLLLLLYSAPEHRMRMGELAHRLIFSPSRLSYQIGVLGKRGWVVRRRVEGDGRGFEAVLTAEGLRAFRELRPAHARDVQELFFSALQDDDAARLAGLMRRVGGLLG